uniref:G_PROTEIN_RECEP_F1_2 domain-containing protein n=1 Tax=Strongyloides papillosus TaxID=174720 RepID=A0A0N5CHU8_STREA
MLLIPMMIGVILCIAAEILLFILLPFMIKFAYTRRSWHLYYKITFLMLLLTITAYALSTCLVDITLLCLNGILQPKYVKLEEKLFYIGYQAQIYTSAFIRSCNWVLVIERTTSTLKRKVYERYRSTAVAISICIVIISYGIIVNNISRIWESFEGHYYKFSIGFDFFTIIISCYLWYKNVKLRRLTIISDINLSEKFQLNENIRLVKFTFPFIAPYILINTGFNLLLDFGQSLLSDTNLILAYNDLCIFISYIIVFIYVLNKNNIIKCLSHRNTNGISSFNRTFKKNESSQKNGIKKLDTTTKQFKTNSQTLQINGKHIPTNYDGDAYQKIVTKAW